MKKFFEEFKAFAMRGNVIDLAVGMIIGSAFGKITSSLVNDVIMPAVSMLMGGVDFTAWKIVLKEAVMEMGADGLMVEVHNDPPHAKCDGQQSLTPEKFQHLMDKISPVVELMGKKLV